MGLSWSLAEACAARKIFYAFPVTVPPREAETCASQYEILSEKRKQKYFAHFFMIGSQASL